MGRMHNLLQSPVAVSVIACVAVFLTVAGLRRAGGMETLELAAYDGYLRLQPKVEGLNPDVVLITITEEDIRNQGRWPISDATLARALEILMENGARAVGVDLFRDIPVPPGEDRLDGLLGTAVSIVTVMKFGDGGIPPPRAVWNPHLGAFNDILVDPDGTVRRGLLFLDDGLRTSYSLALRLALILIQMNGIGLQSDPSRPEYLRLGPTTIPPLEPDDGPYVNADPRGYQFLVDFKETPAAFQSHSLTALLAGEVEPAEVKGKIVLMGIIAQSVKDFFHVPYSQSLRPDQSVSGIALHAHMVSQILRWSRGQNDPIRAAGRPATLLWLFIWSFSGGAAALWVRRPWSFAMVSLACLGGLGLAGYAASVNARWLPVAPPVLAWLLSAGLVKAYVSYREHKERALLMQLFARHVSPRVAELLWREREQFMESGRPRSQQLFATVLFSDLEGFTHATEQLSPRALTDWLNAYLEVMAQVIMEHDGSVDDYAGDGIKADFGVPLARTTEEAIRGDALSAVSCALAMGDEIVRINGLWRQQGLPAARVRIGINSGLVMAGTFGNPHRLKYTTLGDTVNIASRLESYDKEHFDTDPESMCRIFIGEATLRLIGEHFVSKKVAEVMLKGKSQPVGVYHLLGVAGGSSGGSFQGGTT
jgi:adenylate cyclase